MVELAVGVVLGVLASLGVALALDHATPEPARYGPPPVQVYVVETLPPLTA